MMHQKKRRLSAFQQTLSALCLIVGGATFLGMVSDHGWIAPPFWMKAQKINLQPVSSLPASSASAASSSAAIALPFFYSIGHFPTRYQGKRILYQIAHETRPADHFISQIDAHFEQPEIQLILQGPRTPENLSDRNILKNCLLTSLNIPCLMTRKRALDVYIQEAQAYGPKQWKLKWFQVKDRGLYPGNSPNKSEEDQTQGIYLRATSETQIMDRWVLINAHGTHQSIVLIRPNSNEGESAYSFIDQSIRSIKMDHQLESGRELINQALSEIDLDEIQKESNLNTRLNRLLDIQTLLISKLSLEPSSMETFFHLAGTSSLLIQKPDPKHFFWTSLAQSNLKASYLYARDLAPQDPKTAQIQALWMGLNQPEHTEMNF